MRVYILMIAMSLSIGYIVLLNDSITYSYRQATISLPDCIQTFHHFAYEWGKYKTTIQSQTETNWQEIAHLPIEIQSSALLNYPLTDIELIRNSGHTQEIWIKTWDDYPIWLIYKPSTKTWETLPSIIENGLYVDNLLLDKNGDIWGQLAWNKASLSSDIDFDDNSKPILSKFNEDTRRFVIINSSIDLYVNPDSVNYYGLHVSPWPLILTDNEGMFWIIKQFDGIYRYNPVEKLVEKFFVLPDYPIYNAALAKDGSIFLVRFPQGDFHLNLFQFFPNTRKLIPIEMPQETWPIYGDLLIDHNGNLWIGAIGYLDTTGNWNTVHPDISSYFDNFGDPWWIYPAIMLQSSDGKLWFIRHLDGEGSGIGWYDPLVGKGCQVKNTAATIIEDSDSTLWMMIQGILYNYRID